MPERPTAAATEPEAPQPQARGLDVHPLLRAAFAALEAAGVRYCLLRGERELAHPADVDLLVAEAELEPLRAALAPLGFAAIPVWGRGSHRVCVGYDAERGEWLKLDLVAELEFGAHHALRCEGAARCLERRVRVDGVPLLAPDDRFFALLLHCLLDRGRIERGHGASLAELAHGELGGSMLARAVERALPPDWALADLARCAREGDWPALERLAGPLARGLRARGLASLLRSLRNRLLRRLAKPLTALRRRGLRVAVLGVDGAGKSTVAKALEERFFFPVRRVYGGLYPAGNGRRLPKGLSLLVRIGRLRLRSAVARAHQLRGRLVVFDRHPCEAVLAGTAHGARGRLRRALLARACARPDLLLVLDVDPALALARKREHGLEALAAQRARYRELAAALPEAVLVDAGRAPDAVARAVIARVWRQVAERGRWR